MYDDDTMLISLPWLNYVSEFPGMAFPGWTWVARTLGCRGLCPGYGYKTEN
jgi:hypothetical protein